MGLSILGLVRRQPPVEAWAQDAGRALGRAFAAQGISTHLEARRIGPTFILFEFAPRPPTPAVYAALLKQAPTARRLLQVEHATVSERGGRVVVRVPNPQPFALDHRSIEGDGFNVPLGLTDTGAWDGVDFTVTPHVGIFGASGEGKTTLARALLFHLTRQNDAQDARLFVVGRDAGDWQALAGVAHSWGFVRHADAAGVLKWLAAEAERREARGQMTPRLFAVVDDCVTLIQRAPEVGPILDGLSSQARHGGVHLVIISQAATREGTGSAILLKNLTRRYVFGSASAAEAAYSTGRKDTGAQYLVKGEAISVDGRLTRVVAIPNVTRETPFEAAPGWPMAAPWEGERLTVPPWLSPQPAQPRQPVAQPVATAAGGAYIPTQEPLPPCDAQPVAPVVATTAWPVSPPRPLTTDEAEDVRRMKREAQMSLNEITRKVYGYKDGKTWRYIQDALGLTVEEAS